MTYDEFLARKTRSQGRYGFTPVWMPEFLFYFQIYLVEWAIKIGRGAIFADCGLGKTPLQLVWAENIHRKERGNILILTPLAVAQQTVREGNKFGIKVTRTRDGIVHKGINVTNYQQLHKYRPEDFVAVVCDESGILKNFDGKTRKLVTDFMGPINYRLLCTATPAPNDFMELGTSSEALGAMARNSMLGMFFTNDGESTQQWRLKGHAKKRFWQWMASWSRAIRKPSDMGFPDGEFELPELQTVFHKIAGKRGKGFVSEPARTLNEQRDERRKTIRARCEKVAEIVPSNRPCIVWCHLNSEGDLLEKLIPDAVQVAGAQPDELKEERLNAFSQGKIRVLVTKPTIACFGLNWQHCSDVVYFPSHSHEQFYQAIRRCWRFGQEKKVTCNIVHSEAESMVLNSMLRKERQSVELYDGIIREMRSVLREKVESNGCDKLEVPSWLHTHR